MTRKIRKLSAVCRVLLVMALLLPVGTLASGSTGVTGADGRLTFDRLPPALYLVLRTEAAPENAAYAADPFLVSVPFADADGLHTAVTTTPKFGQPESPAPTPAPAPSVSPRPAGQPAGQLPQTGQLNWPIPILLAAGGGLFMLGLALRRQKPGGGKPDGPA